MTDLALSDLNKFALAFENDFPEGEPRDLWRLSALRDFHDREIPHVTWFASEAAAKEHAKWINDGRGRVLAMSHYRLVKEPI